MPKIIRGFKRFFRNGIPLGRGIKAAFDLDEVVEEELIQKTNVVMATGVGNFIEILEVVTDGLKKWYGERQQQAMESDE